MLVQFKGNEGYGQWMVSPIMGPRLCVTLCVHVSPRQKDKEGEFNGVSQGEASSFPLIKHIGSALAP